MIRIVTKKYLEEGRQLVIDSKALLIEAATDIELTNNLLYTKQKIIKLQEKEINILKKHIIKQRSTITTNFKTIDFLQSQLDKQQAINKRKVKK